MKFESGANKFRVLSSAVVGYEYWKTIEGKRMPIRKHMNEKIAPSDLEVKEDGSTESVKHFWAFVVWNYKEGRVQILELTQKSIMNAIQSYVTNEDWGDPKNYDFTVTKSGEGLKTEYSAIASPHKELSQEILDEQRNTPINLEALFKGEDPFQVDNDQVIADAEAILGDK